MASRQKRVTIRRKTERAAKAESQALAAAVLDADLEAWCVQMFAQTSGLGRPDLARACKVSQDELAAMLARDTNDGLPRVQIQQDVSQLG